VSAIDDGLVVRRFWEEVFARGNFDVANEILSAEWILHQSEWTGGNLDLAGLEEMVDAFRERYPNLQTRIDEQAIVEGDRVLTRFTVTGTRDDESQTRVVVEGMSVSLFSGGKIASTWVNWDAFGLVCQEDPTEWPKCWWCKRRAG
jgi:predicted SnoaL-like aldol condensation-catalyzing enzyme